MLQQTGFMRLFISYLAIVIYFSFIPGHCVANEPFERKTVIITGASGELGSSAAKELALDYNLILTGRDIAKLKNLQSELKQTYSGCYEVVAVDYTNKPSRDSFAKYLKSIDTPIAGFVLVTPRPQFHGKSALHDEDIWLEAFRSTFTGPSEILKTTLPHLSNPSKIVVIAGTTSVQLQPEYGSSCVIRRMWTTYIKALSHQLGPQGVCINALSPGVVLTEFHQNRIQKKSEELGICYDDQMKNEVSNIPLQRHAKPLEVAQAIKFLLSEQSNFINGINLILDGGLTVSY